MSRFEDQTYLTQVRRLSAVAAEVLTHYPIQVDSLSFIKYSANAIYKVIDSKGRAYVLRIHPENNHTELALNEEMRWLELIAGTTNLIVPRPIMTNNNNFCAHAKHPTMETTRLCDVLSWVSGRRCWRSINADYASELGRLIAQVQQSGVHFESKHRLYWHADGLVGTKHATFHNVEKLTGITSKQQQMITTARRTVHERLRIFELRYPKRSGFIHADMQPNNILVREGQYAVIDFDDCGFGLYGHDLAVALFAFEYVVESQKRKDYDALRDTLFESYSNVMPFDQYDIDISNGFLLARKLMVLGWLEVRKTNPKLQAYFTEAVQRTITYAKSNNFC